MDEDLNELLLKKIKLQEDDQDEEANKDSMDYSNSDEEEYRSREQLIHLLRSYIQTKRERQEQQKLKSMDDDDEEDARMFKSIRSMMLGSGSSSGGANGSSSSNTTSLEEDDEGNEDGLDRCQQPPDETDYDNDDLPSNLIVTGLPLEIFTSSSSSSSSSGGGLKQQFEDMFTRIDPRCRFSYFRLLKRCCIQFEEPLVAVLARLELDRIVFDGAELKMYLNKPIKLKNTRAFLEPPKNDKTFLISPPASPPVDWEQHLEEAPVVNLDLLVALSKLDPHEPCELVKSNENTPGIIIHPCPDAYTEDMPPDHARNMKFIPTKRPPNYMD